MRELPREIAPGVFWIGQCHLQRVRGKVYHAYAAAYLVVGETASCVIETGGPEDYMVIKRHMEVLLKGRPPLKYAFLTHQETPHAGSIGRIMELYPEAKLCGDISDYHLEFPQYADRMLSMELGDTIDLGGRKLQAIEPIIRDLRSTLWAFDTQQRVLFPGDGFAYSHFHEERHCGLMAEEATNLDLKDMSAVFAERALYWTKFLEMEPFIEAFEDLVRSLKVQVIAPTHGLPVGNVPQTMPLVMEGLRFGSAEKMTPQGDLAQVPADGGVGSIGTKPAN